MPGLIIIGLIVLAIICIPLLTAISGLLLRLLGIILIVTIIYWGVTQKLPGPLAALWPDDSIKQAGEHFVTFVGLAKQLAYDIPHNINRNVKEELNKNQEGIGKDTSEINNKEATSIQKSVNEYNMKHHKKKLRKAEKDSLRKARKDSL